MIRPLHDRDLYAYVAGGLDPGDALAVERAVAADPVARRRLDWLRARVDQLVASSRWHVPALPLPGRAPGVRLGAEVGLHMGDNRARPGERLVLRVSPPGPAEAWCPVVVREVDRVSEVLFPTGPEEWVTLDQWPAGPEGVEIELVLAEPPGLHRYVVALLSREEAVDWSLPATERWADLRDRVEDGRVPASAVSVRVEP